jgi:pilus assembly protein CpaB
MNRSTRTMVVMGVAILTATLASVGIYYAIQSVPVREVEVGSQLVVVSARNLSVGTRLQTEHLKLEKWPSSSLVKNSFATVEELVGRGLIASVTENEPITEIKLAPREAGAGLSPTIPEGMRAMSVKVDDVVGVAGFVVPGTRVDMLVTLRQPGQANAGGMARTLLSNILVLYSGTNSTGAETRDKPAPVTVVTVAVTPSDMERLVLAAAEGQISLALRNPLDDAPTDTKGVSISALLNGDAPVPAPVAKPVRVTPRRRPEPVVMPLPPPSEPERYIVETIRGAERTDEEVD